MATSVKHSISTSFSSYVDYTFTDTEDSNYTIEDISLVLDTPDTSTTSKTTSDTPKRARRSRIQYGGSGRRQVRQTAANDSSIFCEVTPLSMNRNFLQERISDSIISIDEDISYDDTYIRDRMAKTHVQTDRINTDNFRRFSPRRVAVKLMSTSKRAKRRQSGVTKIRTTPQRQSGVMKFLFLGKYGCLNKVID